MTVSPVLNYFYRYISLKPILSEKLSPDYPENVPFLYSRKQMIRWHVQMLLLTLNSFTPIYDIV